MASGQYGALQAVGELYAYQWDWIADYPWALDFDGPSFTAGQAYPGTDNWNLTAENALNAQLVAANNNGNLAAFIKASDQMNAVSNNAVYQEWTYYPKLFFAITSNVQGFYYNPSFQSASFTGPPFVAFY
jgi:hypothetical protein